jgi:hypothetical protein
VIDFDRVTRDPENPKMFLPLYDTISAISSIQTMPGTGRWPTPSTCPYLGNKGPQLNRACGRSFPAVRCARAYIRSTITSSDHKNGSEDPSDQRRRRACTPAIAGRGVDRIKILLTESAELPDTDPRTSILSDNELAAVRRRGQEGRFEYDYPSQRAVIVNCLLVARRRN